MSRLIRFIRHYKLLTLAVVAIIVGLILEGFDQHTAVHWLLGTVAIIEVLPLLWDMWQDVRAGKYGIDILAITAIVAAVILGQYWAAIVVVLMLTGGEALEHHAEHRAQSELNALLAQAPRRAHVLRKKMLVEVPVDNVKIGDVLIIRAGDVVPVDAAVIEGGANFDESSLTGESLPQRRAANDQLLSGSVNLDGEVTAKALAIAADSQYQQIVRLVRGASQSQAPFIRLAERYSLPFTFTAYAIASAVWVVSGHAIRFLEVIIVATPCPLLLAAPIALISGMARASRYGIIVKNGSALERLAEAETIAFDKTGTLTRGELSVKTVTVYNGFDKTEVLRLAASLEQSSRHVVAQAIVRAADTQSLKLIKAKHVREVSGQGLSAVLQAKPILVGRRSLLEAHDVSLKDLGRAKLSSATSVYVAVDGQLAGLIHLSDEPRTEAIGTLDRLRREGLKHMLLVTGDNASTAKAVAGELGIDTVHAEALPADKLHILEKIKQRPLVFVGDGVNDAPSLASSDVGIALGARGSTAASESADMVIMTDDLSRVAVAYHIAKRTFKIARQSILAGIALSLLLMAAFATGKFPPLAGALLQEVVDVVVIFNALRAHLINPET